MQSSEDVSRRGSCRDSGRTLSGPGLTRRNPQIKNLQDDEAPAGEEDGVELPARGIPSGI
jgi:hypothetical protein